MSASAEARNSAKDAIYLVLAVMIAITGCKSTKLYDQAPINSPMAVSAIKQLKKEPLLIVLPTESKKEKILQNRNMTEDLEKLVAERRDIQNALVDAFSDSLTFTSTLFIPDTSLSQYLTDPRGLYFVNRDLELDANLKSEIADPFRVIFIDYNKFEVVRDEGIVPNPFPNNLRVGFYKGHRDKFTSLLLNASDNWDAEKLGKKVAKWNRRLIRFYNAAVSD